jgi:hypothetical protein
MVVDLLVLVRAVNANHAAERTLLAQGSGLDLSFMNI